MSDLVMNEAVISPGAVVVRAPLAGPNGTGLNLPLAGALFLHLAALLLLVSAGGGGGRELPPQPYPIRLYSAAEVAVGSGAAELPPPLVRPERRVAPAKPAVVAERLAALPAPSANPQPPTPTQSLAPVSGVAVGVEPLVPVAEGVVALAPAPAQSGGSGAAAAVSGMILAARVAAATDGVAIVPGASGVAGAAIAAPATLAVVSAQPLYRENPAPEYPPLARRRGWEGTVILAVQVGVDGRAGDLRLHHSSGRPLLDEAAGQAVKGWRFEPGRRGAEPVAMQVLVPVRFGLQ